MWRAIAWGAAASFALLGKLLDNPFLRTAGVLLFLGALAISAPRHLRAVVWIFFALALALVAGGNTDGLLDAVPAAIAAMIAWLFARTLFKDRVPLIARAIKAIDGPEPLADPAVARYARRLTIVWALYQAALAAFGLLLAAHAQGFVPQWPLPSPARFGLVILPAAVAILFVGEFALRRWLVPQAPHHSFIDFLRRLIGSWPALIDD